MRVLQRDHIEEQDDGERWNDPYKSDDRDSEARGGLCIALERAQTLDGISSSSRGLLLFHDLLQVQGRGLQEAGRHRLCFSIIIHSAT